MALENYLDLVLQTVEWLDRTDLSAQIPMFIRLAESDFEPRLNKHYRALTRATTTLVSGDEYFTVPPDVKKIKSIWIVENDCKYPLTALENSQLIRNQMSNERSRPTHYALIGNEIQVAPVPEREYTIEIVYYTRIDGINEATPTNWVLTYYPNVYLFGTLVMANNYIGNDQRTAFFVGLYQNSLDAAIQEGLSLEQPDGPGEIFPDYEVY